MFTLRNCYLPIPCFLGISILLVAIGNVYGTIDDPTDQLKFLSWSPIEFIRNETPRSIKFTLLGLDGYPMSFWSLSPADFAGLCVDYDGNNRISRWVTLGQFSSAITPLNASSLPLSGIGLKEENGTYEFVRIYIYYDELMNEDCAGSSGICWYYRCDILDKDDFIIPSVKALKMVPYRSVLDFEYRLGFYDEDWDPSIDFVAYLTDPWIYKLGLNYIDRYYAYPIIYDYVWVHFDSLQPQLDCVVSIVKQSIVLEKFSSEKLHISGVPCSESESESGSQVKLHAKLILNQVDYVVSQVFNSAYAKSDLYQWRCTLSICAQFVHRDVRIEIILLLFYMLILSRKVLIDVGIVGILNEILILFFKMVSEKLAQYFWLQMQFLKIWQSSDHSRSILNVCARFAHHDECWGCTYTGTGMANE